MALKHRQSLSQKVLSFFSILSLAVGMALSSVRSSEGAVKHTYYLDEDGSLLK